MVVGVYLWSSPRPKPAPQSPTATSTQPSATTPAQSPATTPAAFIAGNIVTVAGSPLPIGDGGPATAAQLSGPVGLALDSGSLYIADGGNNRVRRVDLATGTITTFAGTGEGGYGGDGGPATAAQLSSPRGLAVDSGNLYVADSGNNRIRRVDLATGTITTFAGTGEGGHGGDGGPATAAQLSSPRGLALDSGNLYVADSGNNRIRRVNLSARTITTFAGNER
ncbi:MAG: hypothetical protein KJ624_00905 [Chloroflexi bacterium]|nr:hypothetical protein [Chloroflexota bacterium]